MKRGEKEGVTGGERKEIMVNNEREKKKKKTLKSGRV